MTVNYNDGKWHGWNGRDARADAAMLKSMSASFRSRMDFSFNPDDMADLMERCADVVKPGPFALPPAQEVAPAGEPVAWMLDGYGPTENRGFAEIYSRKKGVRVTPLYAVPTVPAEASLAAMTSHAEALGRRSRRLKLLCQILAMRIENRGTISLGAKPAQPRQFRSSGNPSPPTRS